jgi:cytochrome c peroxidase
MKKKLPFLFIIGLIIVSCTKDQMPLLIELDNELRAKIKLISPDGTTDFYKLPNENDLSVIPQDVRNPLTPEKVNLGKLLFYDTGLGQDAVKDSGMGTFSCASCHIPEAGFRPGTFQGIADGGKGFGINGEGRRKQSNYTEAELDVQSARPLSLLNVAYVSNTFWSGKFGSGGVNVGTEDVWDMDEEATLNHLGFEAIETQNLIGIKTHRITINKDIADNFGYTEMFDEVFPDYSEEERYSQETASFAISAYIRTLISNKAPFQNWLNGENGALSYDEKKGGILFFGKAQCFQCHYDKNLGSEEFHALGVNDMDQIPSFNTAPDDKRNLGRGGFTLKEEDNFKFRVPQLYNMEGTEFYFHGSSKRNIRDVIEYKLAAQAENSRVDQSLISNKLNPIDLTEEEISQLETFIRSSLKDPDLTRYQPVTVPSGFCFPNNDPESVLDLGCN